MRLNGLSHGITPMPDLSSPSSPQTGVVFDLAVLLLPDLERKRNMLHFLEKAGVRLACSSGLDRNRTKGALRDAGVLSYLTDLYFDGMVFPSDSIFVGLPEEATFSAIESRLPFRVRAPACARVYT